MARSTRLPGSTSDAQLMQFVCARRLVDLQLMSLRASGLYGSCNTLDVAAPLDLRFGASDLAEWPRVTEEDVLRMGAQLHGCGDGH